VSVVLFAHNVGAAMHGQTFQEASARESSMRVEHVDDFGEAHYRSLNEGAGRTEVAQRDGWYLVATEGSHRQFKHRTKSGRVTVAGKPGHDLPPGTLNSIIKQAGLKKLGE